MKADSPPPAPGAIHGTVEIADRASRRERTVPPCPPRIRRSAEVLCASMDDGSRRVRLYTKRWCVYCLAAKRLFRRLGVPYDDLPVDRDPELRRRASAAAGGWHTVPMVFVGDTFIGGYSEARALHARGELTALIETVERSGP